MPSVTLPQNGSQLPGVLTWATGRAGHINNPC
jgi:hypothetical protein